MPVNCLRKTLFALATAPGKSGIAVIRVSGSNALSVLRAFGYDREVRPRHATYATLFDPVSRTPIDDVLFLYFPGPASFTGEDTLEIHCHGGRAVVDAFITALQAMPEVSLAGPGEFSKRAFINGKMDLTQAEGLADMIDAETAAQHHQAMRQMKGGLQKIYDRWRSELIHALAFIHAYVDFPDEDLPDTVTAELIRNVARLAEEIAAHLDDNNRGEKLRDGLKVAIIGAPNCGKSSLLNWLARRDVAIVSPLAGTTRDVIEVHLTLHGYPVTLYDTAGLRESTDTIENEGMQRARRHADEADLTIALFDVEHVDDSHTLELLGERSLVVINKIDLGLPPASNLSPWNPLFVSIKTGEGMETILEQLVSRMVTLWPLTDSPVITRARYRQHLSACLDYLQAFSCHKPIELMAEDLRMAAQEIGKITGHIDIENILDVIFSSFCIGK